MDIRLNLNGDLFLARRSHPGRITLVVENQEPVTLQVTRLPGGGLAVETDKGIQPAEAVRDRDTVWVRLAGRTYRFEIVHGRSRRRTRAGGGLVSPMPGQVQRVLVAAGDVVSMNQPLLVVEAMKMQFEIKAPHAGTVKQLLAAEGDQVEAEIPLVEISESEPSG